MAVTADCDVTASVIAKGAKASSIACPVAIALQASGAPTPTKVGLDYAYCNGHARKKLDNTTRQWIADYNAGKDVQPFSFSITFT